MENINKAIAAKIEKTINIKMRYPEGIMTRREWLNFHRVKGASVEDKDRNRIDFNRTKYNRMNGHEQEEYERKCAEKVPGYRLNLPDGGFYDITKTEYDYFLNMDISEEIQTEKHDLQNRIEAGIATSEEIAQDEEIEIGLFNKYFH